MNTVLENSIEAPALLPHPAAEYFPLIEGRAFDDLKSSISTNGLLMPITLCEGKILDGRNRYRACAELGIEPRFQQYSGESPVAGAWALNGERRHLTISQRAAIAVKMLAPLKEEAKKRQQFHGGTAPGKSLPPDPAEVSEPSTGEAVYQAAALVGVGKSVVQEAQAVSKADPALFQQIEAGKVTVGAAYKIAKGRTTAPPPPPSQKQRRERRALDIARLAREGHRVEQIAEELGIKIQQVRKIADAEGIHLANRAEGLRKSHRINAHRVVEETVSTLEGLALGLQTVGDNMIGISADDAREWEPSITQSLKALTRLRKNLLEIARG